ncbi:NAD(P)H-dependent oxidoreductase [Flavobacterium sp. LPB0248]|uniref:NAD(P)H-dependent oxidoreductase n=1 Tax=Flavobacterium sp. LPB0248 TaxID=2614441 RepID=UPI0015A7199B|nr:NAD(P)H-dependent oxidoreductase [Flavobacterium sp. LPB0248]QLC64836.1 NAD(P)H-dependent oxidoreductase [Flavobacterium sp. LPB0248]
MKHLIIYAHPDNSSLNCHFRKTVQETLVKKGNEVIIRDLNQLGFNPVLSIDDIAGQRKGIVSSDVLLEQQHIIWSDSITFIYPIWWTGMPAIMKGYIDRVFSYGFAYCYEQGIQKGLLSGKSAYIINTHGKSKAEYEALGMDKALLLTSDKGIFQYCGFQIKEHAFFDKADRASSDDVTQWTSELIQIYHN